MKHLWRDLVFVVAITNMCIAPITPILAQQLANSQQACAQFAKTTQSVVSVIDAHTLKLDDGSKVRLVGALPPFQPTVGLLAKSNRNSANVIWPPLQQSTSALAKLVIGRTVQLAFGRRKADRYGHLLAQVYLLPRDGRFSNRQHQTKAPSILDKEGRLWLQAYLIANGLARAYGLPDSNSCLSRLTDFEHDAVIAKKGLWQHGTYRIRSAKRTNQLKRYIGTYQIVEGRIVRQSGNRNRLYLNFGDDWRRDFTIGVNNKDRKAVFGDSQPRHNLSGAWIKVRGWIERRGGPYIQVTMPGQIKVLAEQSIRQ